MFRIIALTTAVIMWVFTLYISNASYEQKQRLPRPLLSMAEIGAGMVVDISNVVNETVGIRLKKGMERTKGEIKAYASGPTATGSEGVIGAGADMSGQDLTAKLLANSIFTRANLENTIMTKTFLQGSQLDSATLVNAKISRAIMTNMTARGADFSSTLIEDTDMTGIQAQGALFKETEISNSILSAGQYSGTDFSGSAFVATYLDQSIFFGANFNDVTFYDVNMSRANLEQVRGQGAVFDKVEFYKTKLAGANFSGADLSTATALTQEQLSLACGNAETKLPEGMTIPTCPEVSALR